ncbi:type IV pilus secretin PilQ [Stutzerimonas nitrititolerans]|uniref:type IV pilus secretin PilQ n=1 Tax=Stutzerimonas nitrititolerans TaxID=2482751 RepID=UPI0028B259CA|nr:type IV pilus secretin PilQ [Stutzerimonas nitrititolerans]
MNSTLSRLGLSLMAALASPALLAANLNALDVASLPGDRVELKLDFDEPVAAPRGYTLDQPARIALDLPGVSSKLDSKNRELGVGNARSVTVVEAQGRTRLIVNLTTLVPYSTRVDGNNLFVVLGESGAAAPAAVAPVAAPVAQPAPAAVQSKSISNIDFRRGDDGAGNVVISLSDPSISPNIEEQGGKIRVTFAKTQLPEALRVRLDVQDFATPVKFVDATSQGGAASIAIEPSGRYDYLAYQTDDKLTISIKPLTADEAEKRNAEHFAYSGEKLSLNFQDIDVRSVLQLIADFTDLNLVASDTVQGNITLRLQNVPWDQALALVLKTKGLDKRQVGNVLLVAPADEIAARERQELESQRQIAELAPLRREVVQVNYAKAADIARLFQSVTSNGASTEDRGSIAVDDRTNNIIAYQTQERLDELRRIVAQLDIPVRQVMIEARIVEANVDYDKALGVRWGGNYVNDQWSAYGKDGSRSVDDDGFVRLPGTDTVGGFKLDEGVAPVPFVDMGVLGSTSGVGIGFISDHVMLDLQLSAMEKTGNGEVVSQPKVMTADKETAKILKGTEVPYQEASSSGATSTSFKEAAFERAP